MAPEEDLSQSAHGEVVGVLSDLPDPKTRKKGLEVSFINGQIVLDRSTLVSFSSTEVTSRTVRLTTST